MNATILNEYAEFNLNVRKLAKKTREEYVRVVESFHDFDLLNATGPAEIDAAIVKMSQANEWDPVYEYKYSRILKTFYHWLFYKEYTPKNLYPHSEIRKPRSKPAQFLIQEEFEFIKNNDLFLTHQDKTMINLLWDTGVRPSEMALIDVPQLDFKDNLLYIPPEKSKGGYGERHIPFSIRTAELLKSQIQTIRKDYIFIGCNYERINKNEISKRIAHIGFHLLPIKKRLTPYMFRHSLAIRLLEAGATDLEIIKLLGHASISQTIVYAHSTKTHAKSIRHKYLPDNNLQIA